MNPEISVDSEVPLRGSESSQKIPGRVPLPKWLAAGAGWIGERAWIKRFPARVLWAIKVEGLPDNQVWTNQRVETGQGRESCVGDADRLR